MSAATIVILDERRTTPVPDELRVDAEQMRDFLDLTMRYVEDGLFFSSRAFYHDPRRPAFSVRGYKFRPAEEGLDGIVRQLARDATAAARAPEPVVYAPPNALFHSKMKATEATLACAPTLVIECDEHPAATAQQLQGILGLGTVIVASGGEWVDPQTGAVEPKLHVYWRLRELATDTAGFIKVKYSRRMMAALGGGDPTAVPSVHPLRMPGSLHTKDPTNPRRCFIAARNPDAEIDLDEAVASLEDACALAGIDIDGGNRRTNPDALADSDDDLTALAAAIPNGPSLEGATAAEKARDQSERWEALEPHWVGLLRGFWRQRRGPRRVHRMEPEAHRLRLRSIEGARLYAWHWFRRQDPIGGEDPGDGRLTHPIETGHLCRGSAA